MIEVGFAAIVAVGAGVGVDVESVETETVLASSVTAVCASALPFSVAPVFNTIATWSNMVPLKTAFVPSVVWPATCQKI